MMHATIEPTPLDIADRINAATEAMIALQIEGYPKGWTPAEYREMAIVHLFGRAALAVMS